MNDRDETWTIGVEADTSVLRQELQLATQLGRQFSSTLMKAFEGIAIKGRSLTDAMRSVTLSLSRMVLQAAFRPLEQGIGRAFAGLFSGQVAGAQGFAQGGVLSQGTPIPFAKGGVIASPVAFPLGSGRTGLAGERGAEAIMPLARGSDGRLGVAAVGGGPGMTLTMNITTPDVEGFRRSESQVAAMLARTVALGQRNL